MMSFSLAHVDNPADNKLGQTCDLRRKYTVFISPRRKSLWSNTLKAHLAATEIYSEEDIIKTNNITYFMAAKNDCFQY